MARVNAGINPKYLSDQHLIAESVEITMITGSLRKDGYVVKGVIPEQYCLGKGHMNFFKDKLLYLSLRLSEVNSEMVRRGFNPGTHINLSDFPVDLVWGWTPALSATDLVRERIVERLIYPRKAKPGFHRYYGKPIEDMTQFCYNLGNSELFYV